MLQPGIILAWLRDAFEKSDEEKMLKLLQKTNQSSAQKFTQKLKSWMMFMGKEQERTTSMA